MAKANCGGLILDSATLVTVDNIITTVGSTPAGAVKANCGGVQFDSAVFKKVDDVITDINADEDTVLGFVVSQPGCGGVVLDSNYFEFDDNGAIKFEVPAPPVETIEFKIDSVAETAEEGMTFGDWVVSDYNANGYKVIGEAGEQKIVTSDGTKYVVNDNNPAKPSDEITESEEYPLANV